MSKQQLITIVTLQLVAVLAVGWYLVTEQMQSTLATEPPLHSLPATPALAPPPYVETNEHNDENSASDSDEDMPPFEFHFIE